MEQTKTYVGEAYEEVYKNMKMGAESMTGLLPKVKDETFKKAVTAQLDGYERYAREARRALEYLSEEAKEESFFTRMMAKMGMNMNTMMDDTTGHLAEMVIKGSNMGVTSMTKVKNALEEKNCESCKNVLSLVNEIIKFEETNIEIMKEYL